MPVARLLLFNKPYDVLTQFRRDGDRQTLADFIDDPWLRVAGRLDRDSEGLLLLTDDGALNQRLTHPRHKSWKTYWVQVENIPTDAALHALQTGVVLNDGPTLPARVRRLVPPMLWPRHPPVRFRAQIPTCWLEICIHEGRNRQVRRMTAAIGHPTLRLVRMAIGPHRLDGLQPGESRVLCYATSPRPRDAGPEDAGPEDTRLDARAPAGAPSCKKHMRTIRRDTSCARLRGKRSTR